MTRGGAPALLRVPPFPGARGFPLAKVAPGAPPPEDAELRELADALRRERVGGAFWAARPGLPKGCDLLLAPRDAAEARHLQDRAAARGMAGRAVLVGDWRLRHAIPALRREADPWHLAGLAPVCGGGELALIAALRRPESEAAALARLRAAVAGLAWQCPFTGAPIGWREAVALLAQWRRLIDGNRAIAGSFGIARWKRETLAPLLWNGEGARFGGAARLGQGDRALVWAARTGARTWARLLARQARIGEIEDGFLRSSGLGADCVPPLSVVVDLRGSPVDPSRESDLEAWLAAGDFAPEVLARAAALRAEVVRAGLGKYGGACVPEASPRVRHRHRRRVLVCGQVEDDRAMLLGGCGVTNAALLARARAMEPDAELIWRPHPDVEAGHRRGAVPPEALRHADRIARGGTIAALFAEVDAVHVITSQAGFEALLRGLPVTVHGLPFYAGWGLTRDLAPVPERRLKAGRLGLDALVAAVLILYPRYLDPVSRLPCPPEVLVARLAAGKAGGQAGLAGALVALRRLLGRGRRWWRAWVQPGSTSPPATRQCAASPRISPKGAGSVPVIQT